MLDWRPTRPGARCARRSLLRSLTTGDDRGATFTYPYPKLFDSR